jgi:hypothetical protein
VATKVAVAPESSMTDVVFSMMGGMTIDGGTTAELAGKFVFRLCARSVVPHRQAGGGSQKQLRVLPPCMFVKEAVI